MDRTVEITLTTDDLKKIREVASMLRFLDGANENRNTCWSIDNLLSIADKKYQANDKRLLIKYEE